MLAAMKACAPSTNQGEELMILESGHCSAPPQFDYCFARELTAHPHNIHFLFGRFCATSPRVSSFGDQRDGKNAAKSCTLRKARKRGQSGTVFTLRFQICGNEEIWDGAFAGFARKRA